MAQPEGEARFWAIPKRPLWLGAPALVWLIGLLAAAYAVKCAHVQHGGAFAWQGAAFVEHWLFDDYENLQMSWGLLHGQGFTLRGVPSAWRDPVTPIVMALAFACFGTNYAAVLLVQCLCLVLIAVYAFRAAAALFGWWAGCLAALLSVANLSLLYLAAFPLSEPLSLAFLAMGFASYVTYFQTGRSRSLYAAGVGMALATLTRSNLFPAFVLVMAGLVWRHAHRRAVILASTLFVLVLLPWPLRNAVTFHRFIPFSTRATWAMASDNNPLALSQPWNVPFRWGYFGLPFRQALNGGAPPFNSPAYEPWIEARAGQLVSGYIRQDPVGYVKRSARRFVSLYSPWLSRMPWRMGLVQAVRFFGIIVPGMALIWIRRREPWTWLVWSVGLTVTASATLILTDDTQRYRLPFEPLLAVAAAGLYCSGRQLDRAATRKAEGPVG